MTMTRNEITQMVSDYRTVLEHKVAGEVLVQDRTAQVATLQSRILQAAYNGKLIMGKDADTRKHEERVVLDGDSQYQNLLNRLADAHAAASVANVEFKVQELLTSLTRAWLYAQCPELP